MIKELYESVKLKPFEERWKSGLKNNKSPRDSIIILLISFVVFIGLFLFLFLTEKDYKFIIIIFGIFIFLLYAFVAKELLICCNKINETWIILKNIIKFFDFIINVLVCILWFPVLLFFAIIGNGKISIARSIKYLVCIIFTDLIAFILLFKPYYCLLKILYNALFKTVFDKYIIIMNAKIFILIVFVHLSIYLIYFIQNKIRRVKDDTLFLMYNHTIYLLYFVLLIVLVLFDIWSDFKDSIFNISTIMILLMTIAENVRQTKIVK